jgi:hypothetical protein
MNGQEIPGKELFKNGELGKQLAARDMTTAKATADLESCRGKVRVLVLEDRGKMASVSGQRKIAPCLLMNTIISPHVDGCFGSYIWGSTGPNGSNASDL